MPASQPAKHALEDVFMQVAEIRNSIIPEVRKSGTPEIRKSGTPGIRNSEIRISGNQDSRKAKNPKIQISGNRDSRKCKNPTIRESKYFPKAKAHLEYPKIPSKIHQNPRVPDLRTVPPCGEIPLPDQMEVPICFCMHKQPQYRVDAR